MNGTLVLAGKLAGTAALATGALVTGVSAAHPADAAKQVHCGRGLGSAPQAMKDALKDARHQPAGTERRKALKEVRHDARRGEYGDAGRIAALRFENARLRWRAQAPDALKNEIRAAAKQPAGDERKAAFKKIRADAAAGTYGEKVQKIAVHRQACRAERS